MHDVIAMRHIRKLLAVLLLATSLSAAGLPAYAAAPTGTITDPCGDAPDDEYDLARLDFAYSASSFQIRTENCGRLLRASGWWLAVHLTSFVPEVQLIGTVNDFGKNVGWSGFFLCTGADCEIDPNSFPRQPGGQALANSDYFDNLDSPALSGRSAFGYGGWADLLPGVTIPTTIDWYAEIRMPTTLVDRAPDSSSATATQLGPTRSSVVTLEPTRPVTWNYGFAQHLAKGDLRYESARGTPLVHRFVTIRTTSGAALPSQYAYGSYQYPGGRTSCDACGGWATGFLLDDNTTLRAQFDGDGFTDPSVVTFRALVAAFVSLDLPARLTVRRGAPVRFKGVVRPRADGTTVSLQVRSGSGPWRTYRTLPLTTNQGDTYYTYTWTPVTTGNATFRVLWTSGTTAEGGITNGASKEIVVTVR